MSHCTVEHKLTRGLFNNCNNDITAATESVYSNYEFCDNMSLQVDDVNSNNVEMVPNSSKKFNNSELSILNKECSGASETDSSNQGKLKTTYSRKREASFCLADDAKRRDQLRNGWNEHVELNFMKPQERHHSCCCNSSPESAESLSPNHHSGFGDYTLGSSEPSDTALSFSVDCINCHVCHKDNLEHDSMDVDLQEKEINGDSANCTDLSVQTSAFSAAIYEDLNSLCLTDENASSSAISFDSAIGVTCETESNLELEHEVAVEHAPDSASGDQKLLSPLSPSIFPNVPPTIYFYLGHEKVQTLPTEVCKLLKWKLSTITPVLIRQTVTRSGFRLTKTDGVDWAGTWGKHMKCASFKNVKDFQKVNHFPGSFHLGRKDKLWQNYSKMQMRFGTDVFSFFPDTYILPQDIRLLRQIWEFDGPKKRWIIKPPASARGTGIRVVHKWSQIPKKHPVIVQRYICNPYLINGTKFDLRLYVLVPSYEPLRVYIFDDGLVRFASVKYSQAMRSLGDRFMHLTNYSINRKSATYTANEDENICQGHKWTLKSLWGYMTSRGIDTPKIWAEIVDLVIKTVICAEGPMSRLIRTHTKSRYNCYELFGFDIMLDSDLKPWLLEVNISPSLHTSSLLDTNVKSQLAKDMFNAVGFQIPDKIIRNICTSQALTNNGSSIEHSQSLCMNKALHRWFLSPDEKAKHSAFLLKSGSDYSSILDHLTPDDVRHLVESEDELSRCGAFIRVFPTKVSSKYLKYFEHCRYYNLLLDAWEQKYHYDRAKGHFLLQSLCQKNFHLQMLYKYPVIAKIPAIRNDESVMKKEGDEKERQ